jgi:hypothetical protein
MTNDKQPFVIPEFVILLEPLAQATEPLMRPRNHLHADHLADLGRSGGAGIRGGFHRGDIAPEKSGHVSAADFFPSGKRDIRRFERGVTRFEQSAQAFAFNHSDCLLWHKLVN